MIDSERDNDRVARYLRGGFVDGVIIVSARQNDPLTRIVERALVASVPFYAYSDGQEGMRELLRRAPDIDGVFAASDAVAAGDCAAPPGGEQNGPVIRKHAVVSGYVQGVGFRYYTRAEASHLGLGGYALNLPNGDVEIEIEGSEASVRRMLTWLGHGPSSAVVRSLDVWDVPPTGDMEFVIAF